ncbi:MAG TPA: hypothetical protein VF257_00990 [Solirubrobacteraceae bacterium]
MPQRVFFLNTLHSNVDPADYEDWVRTVDYPVARRQPAIESYVVSRLEGQLQEDNDDPLPCQYLEVIEITDIDSYRAGLQGNPDMEDLLTEWATYVDKSQMVWAEVVE